MKQFYSHLCLVALMSLISISVCAKTETSTSNDKSGEVVVLTQKEFIEKVFDYENNPTEWKYKGNKPSIIDFYADWCGPCKQIAPMLKDLAKEYSKDIVIYKVNVDKEKSLASAFGIQSIPTLLFIPATGKPMIIQGALPKEDMIEQIDTFLLSK